MEPVGLAVGVLGLASLFSASLDAVGRFESWRNFSDEYHLVRTLLEGQKLRLRLWGRAVGFDNGDVSANHYEALDDPQIRSMIRIYQISRSSAPVQGCTRYLGNSCEQYWYKSRFEVPCWVTG